MCAAPGNVINRLYDQHVGYWQPTLEGLDYLRPGGPGRGTGGLPRRLIIYSHKAGQQTPPMSIPSLDDRAQGLRSVTVPN